VIPTQLNTTESATTPRAYAKNTNIYFNSTPNANEEESIDNPKLATRASSNAKEEREWTKNTNTVTELSSNTKVFTSSTAYAQSSTQSTKNGKGPTSSTSNATKDKESRNNPKTVSNSTQHAPTHVPTQLAAIHIPKTVPNSTKIDLKYFVSFSLRFMSYLR
jgi:hypothetical protein